MPRHGPATQLATDRGRVHESVSHSILAALRL